MGFALVLIQPLRNPDYPPRVAPVENPMVKTKLRGLALLRIFLVTGKLHEHKTAGQRA
jgi:hypothetical protein